METIYADQEPRTTAVYLNGERVLTERDTTWLREETLKARYTDRNYFFSERVVFGQGRVALVFKLRG